MSKGKKTAIYIVSSVIVLIGAVVIIAQFDSIERICRWRGGKAYGSPHGNGVICYYPAPDAGKTCTDSAQCQGDCFADSATATTGQCQATTDPYGFLNRKYEMRDGKAVNISGAID